MVYNITILDYKMDYNITIVTTPKKKLLQLSFLVIAHKSENKSIIINLKWIIILLFFEATKSYFHPLSSFFFLLFVDTDNETNL